MLGVGWGVLTGLLVPVAFRNKCERATGPKPEPFQSICPGVNATRTSGTGLERDRNANRNRCEQGLTLLLTISEQVHVKDRPKTVKWYEVMKDMGVSGARVFTLNYTHKKPTSNQLHGKNT